jgi:hypothetical protein
LKVVIHSICSCWPTESATARACSGFIGYLPERTKNEELRNKNLRGAVRRFAFFVPLLVLRS